MAEAPSGSPWFDAGDVYAGGPDVDKRTAMYAEIRQIVQQDAPLTFVHYETINYLMNNDVAGSTVNPTLELRLGDVGFTS